MLNFIVVFCGFFIAVALARIFLDRNLLYDRMGLLSGYRPTLGTDTVYVYRVDIAVYCGNCG